MTFLYPSFLWALFALLIPIIVHLFNFRKTRKVYFSNTAFIKQVQETSSAKRRLKHWLVLASRLLFIFFLVLLFAQPIIPANRQLKAGTAVALYLDNSSSMAASLPDGSRAFDVGLSVIRTIVQNFPPETRYRFLTNNFEPYANSLKSKNEILEKLASVRISEISRTGVEVSSRFKRLGDESEIFWISDFQKSTFGQDRINDSTSNYHLVPLTPKEISNVFIDSIYLDNPFAIGGERNTLHVRINNDGRDDRGPLTIKLVIDGIQAGTVTATILGNSHSDVAFDIRNAGNNLQKAILSFNDSPITFDNEFFGVLNFTTRIRVFEIKPENAPTLVEKVFGNKTIFDFVSTSMRNVNYALMNSTDFVVLNQIDQLDQTLVASIRTYLEAGGSVILIPSAKPDITSYKALWPTITQSQQKNLTVLVKPDFKSPFFNNIFQEQNTQLALPMVKNSIEWGVDKQALLNQQDGKPYLSVIKNQGALYLLGGPLQDDFGSFGKHALFVPVMYRVAAFSKQNQKGLYNDLASQIVTFTSDSLPKNKTLMLVGPTQFTPNQRINKQQMILDLSGLDLQAGHYAVQNGSDTITWLAFNRLKAESYLKVLSTSEIQDKFAKADFYKIENTDVLEIEKILKENYQGISLWKYALVAALFFLLLEIVLLRFIP